jgi:hypothetical protein
MVGGWMVSEWMHCGWIDGWEPTVITVNRICALVPKTHIGKKKVMLGKLDIHM